MREILFRGKRISNDEWVEGGIMKTCHLNYDTRDCYCICANNKDYFVEQSTIGQFTGLTDKNGTKIFEGDILQGTITSAWNKELIKCEVVYERGCFISVGDSKDWTYKLCFGKDIEVIGNIHDNPDLLKE